MASCFTSTDESAFTSSTLPSGRVTVFGSSTSSAAGMITFSPAFCWITTPFSWKACLVGADLLNLPDGGKEGQEPKPVADGHIEEDGGDYREEAPPVLLAGGV